MRSIVDVQQLPLDVDPITAFLERDWASIGGWSLFIGLVILIVVGVYRGWWVPGWMYRAQSKTLAEAMEQNKLLLIAAEITKHFFESTAPKPKRGSKDVE